jgi:serine protein kinase
MPTLVARPATLPPRLRHTRIGSSAVAIAGRRDGGTGAHGASRTRIEEDSMTDIFDSLANRFERTREEELSLEEYLELCQREPVAYATAAERMLAAIGEPTLLDTRDDPRLSRIFQNKIVKIYPSFEEFYGLEEVIEQVVAFFRHAAQGLEERKQILYLLGPVGGGKSSIAERLKQLIQRVPFYALKDSPVNESPLGLFNAEEDGQILEERYGIPRRYVNKILSPWAVKRLDEFGGDIRRFRVVRRYPSILKQIAVSKTEPGDENNQDISSLVGKIDIRRLEQYAQNDPDAYSFSGGLCLSNQGLLEFVEMFKAPIKVLHPLLTATQEGNFKGTEGFGAIPFDGIVLAHSNESEWKLFRNNKNNEAFLDRIYIVKVPYCLRVTEEVKIYEKLVRTSSLAAAPCAPGTLRMMAQFSVLTRLKEPENSNLFSKMRVYDGENLKDTDPKAKPIQEYRDYAGVDEGMSGISTRWAFKILSKVFNFDHSEVAANPVHLLYVLEQQIEREQFAPEVEQQYISFVKEYLAQRYVDFIGKEIQTAYLESYSEYGQNIFDRYVSFADYWIQDQEFRDPDTGESFDRGALNNELEKIEKPAGIANPKDFRHEIVNFVLRARAGNHGRNPLWTSYEKLRRVIEKKMFSSTEELLPVISFNAKASAEDMRKHADFVDRMVAKGYTPKQVRLLCEWYLRVRKSS